VKLTETKKGRRYSYRIVKGKPETNNFSVICFSSHSKLRLEVSLVTSLVPWDISCSSGGNGVASRKNKPGLGMKDLGGDS
jgi:hypothetical protein